MTFEHIILGLASGHLLVGGVGDFAHERPTDGWFKTSLGSAVIAAMIWDF